MFAWFAHRSSQAPCVSEDVDMVGEDSEDKGGKDPAKFMNVSNGDSINTKFSLESDDSETDVALPASPDGDG